MVFLIDNQLRNFFLNSLYKAQNYIFIYMSVKFLVEILFHKFLLGVMK